MIKKRLLEIVPESKKYIAENVVFQWLGMCCNIVMVFTIAHILNALINGTEIQYGMRLYELNVNAKKSTHIYASLY